MIESIVFTRPAKAVISFNNWAMSGFKLASKDTIELRKEICKSCEFWDNRSFNNTGKCNKCGCSTWAKLRLNTEKCPIGKWGVIKKTLE